MADFAALPIFTDALMADTQHLDDGEFGRYMRLLIITWRSPECRIPNDPVWISKRLHVDPLQYDRIVKPLITEFFRADAHAHADAHADASQWLTQKRLKKEWRYTIEKREKNRSAAKSRWEKGKGTCERISKRNAPSPSPSPTIEDTNVSSAKAAPPKPSSVEISMWFENVWQAYPGRGKDGATGTAYKGGKQDARKAFTKIINKTEETDHEALVRNIIAGCQRYAGHLERSGYPSKHCSTWLNASGWSDDYDSTASLPAAGGRAGYSLNAVMQGALADKTNLGPEGRTERLARLGISTFASDAGAGSVLGGPVAGALPAPGRDQGPDRD